MGPSVGWLSCQPHKAIKERTGDLARGCGVFFGLLMHTTPLLMEATPYPTQVISEMLLFHTLYAVVHISQEKLK